MARWEIEPGPPAWREKWPKIDRSHRKVYISISVSFQCTKKVIVLLHTVMVLDFNPKEFDHVPWNPNLKWIWTGGEKKGRFWTHTQTENISKQRNTFHSYSFLAWWYFFNKKLLVMRFKKLTMIVKYLSWFEQNHKGILTQSFIMIFKQL